MPRLLSVFAAGCVLWATLASPAHAAIGRDRIAALRAGDGVLVFTMETGREVVPAHLYLPHADQAMDRLQGWIGREVTVSPQGADRYGRSLAILTSVGEKRSFQEQLLEAGDALVYSPTGFRQSAAFMAAEERARAAQRGIWKTHAVRDLWLDLRPEDLGAQHDQHFVRVAGHATRVYPARDAYYINFGDDWKTDFSIRIPRKAWRAFGDRLAVYAGDAVQARGVIIQENGPMIVVTRPEQLEIRHAQP